MPAFASRRLLPTSQANDIGAGTYVDDEEIPKTAARGRYTAAIQLHMVILLDLGIRSGR